MVVVEKKQIQEIPLLHIVEHANYTDPLPMVIFFHGFSSTKEKNLHYAHSLAEKGFRVVMPDALFHGERQTNLTGADINIYFWDIVLNTIKEIQTVKQYFEEKGFVNCNRIGLAGTSMGGIVTLGALTQYPWAKAAVSLMGMPSFEEFTTWQFNQLERYGITVPITEKEKQQLFSKIRPFDLSLAPTKLQNRPLLFWHGKKDPVVPFVPTYQFYEKIKENYRDNIDRLQFIADEEAGHMVSREGELQTVAWFEKYL